MKRTGILLVNLGTPRSYSRKDVATYLREFLMDGRVIDIPSWKRWLLVNLIIVPFRAPKVAREYQKLWLEGGSPLLVYGKELTQKLTRHFSDEVVIELAMRYQQPSIENGLDKLRRAKVDELIIFPLFPQYASATTGSVAEKVMEIASKWNVIPSIKFMNSYHQDEQYIISFATKVKNDLQKHRPQQVLFSYHGIPERHLSNINERGIKRCNYPNCECAKGKAQNRYCYRSACFETSRLIATQLGLAPEAYTTSFQSRLGKDPWIKPYTDQTIVELAKKGVTNLLVVSPSFVADCLETTLEIGEQYKDLFVEHGGENFHFTESLNAGDQWAKAVYSLITKEMGETKNWNEKPERLRISHELQELIGIN